MTAEYSVIRFSPSPELVESVNVAIVFWDPAPRVVFDPRFPRLSCIAPSVDPNLLGFYLRDLEGSLTGPSGFQSASSQFELGEPRQIRSPVGPDVEKTLKEKFLHRGSSVASIATRERVAAYIDTDLHRFLVERVGVSEANLKKRAAPRDFLSSSVVGRHFPENGLSVSRVIVGAKSLVLTDGIHRGHGSMAQLEQRASRIGSAFYRLDKAREDILKTDRRRLYRAVVFFGKARSGANGRMEYIEEVLRRESDYQEEAISPSEEFVRVAREATQGLF